MHELRRDVCHSQFGGRLGDQVGCCPGLPLICESTETDANAFSCMIGLIPMLRRTCDGSGMPEAHAAPVDMAR